MGAQADPNYITIVASLAPAPEANDPSRYINAICNAIGRQMQRLHGRPMTRVRSDFGPNDSILLTETTLGFPPSGGVWVGGRLHTYTGITAAAFTGVSTMDGLERTQVIPTRTEVSPYLSMIPPS